MVHVYAECSTERPSGMSAMAIPISVFKWWCDDNGIVGDARRHLTHVLRLVDGEIIRRERAREKAERAKPKVKRKP